MTSIKISHTYSQSSDCVIFQGDCLDLLSTIPDGDVRLVVTSPPYNLGKPYEKRVDLDVYLKQQQRVIRECVRILHSKGSLCWQVGNHVDDGEIFPLDIALYPIFRKSHLRLRNRIVWHYGHGLHASRRFSGRYEVVLWFTKGDNYVFNLDAVRTPQKYPNKKHFKGEKKGQASCNPEGKNPSDIWDIPNVKANHVEKTSHPCQFPVELVERLVLALTDKGDRVLDPFMGSGSTAIAALMHGRRAVGAEILPEYIAIALDRIRRAEKGELRVRPIERAVHDPSGTNIVVGPKLVRLGSKGQQELF